MVEIEIGGEENIKNLFQKNEIYYLKIIEKQMFFLNIFLYIINITYIDINNKLKIKPKLTMTIKQNDDLKMKNRMLKWKQNNKCWKFELEFSRCVFLKNEILVVDGIENVDVKKFGNGNVIDGGDGVFKKNIKKIY